MSITSNTWTLCAVKTICYDIQKHITKGFPNGIPWLAQPKSWPQHPDFLLLGFIFGLSFETQFLLHAISPLILIMIYPMIVGVRLRQLFQPGENVVQGWALGVNFILIPMVLMI